jgi:hypothetical protein
MPETTMRDSQALLILLLALAAFLGAAVAPGQAIFPHANDRELGAPPTVDAGRPSSRKHSDASSQFVPELHHQLTGDRSGWISVWNPHVELGRPTAHMSAISPAFWPTRLLSWLSGDAFRVYTWLSMLAIASTCLFAMLLLRAEGLAAPAALAGALTIGLGVFASYWATFALFVFGLAWTLAWLWLNRLWLARRDPLALLGVVVAVQALLLSAYPQQIVWHVGFVVLYTLHAASAGEGGLRARLPALAWIAIAAVLGVLAAAPVYVDLALDAARSARLDAPVEFFQQVLPRVDGLADALAQMSQLYDASLYGDAFDPRRTPAFDGLSLTPLVVFGIAAACAERYWRRDWPLELFVGVALVATYSSAAYGLGVESGVLGLSRFVPLAGALVPIAILAARGFDALLRDPSPRPRLAVGFLAGTALLLCASEAFGSAPLIGSGVVAAASFAAAAAIFALRPSGRLLVAIALASVFVYARPLLLVRPIDEIRTDSALVQALHRATSDGSRFAWVDRFVIPSNQETLLGLRSVHTYNSLSSRAYQRWTRRVSARGAISQGRSFQVIDGTARLSPRELRQADVGVLVAPVRLDAALARPVARSGPLWIHRSVVPPVEGGQAETWSRALEGGAVLSDEEFDSAREVEFLEASDDHVRIRVASSDATTLVWVGWQFHPRWIARGGGRHLETLIVDDLFQGVLVPAGVEEVELRFEPWVRWAWVPQACLLVAASACFFARRRRTGVRPSDD